jgi:hypothetical protein
MAIKPGQQNFIKEYICSLEDCHNLSCDNVLLSNLKKYLKKYVLLSDDSFLLRFLRVKKFSLPMAQQVLLKYINLRQTFSHLLYNLDYLDPNINDLFSNGYVNSLKQ